MARRIGHAIVVMLDRINAGAVAITCLGQTIKRPQIAFTNRKAGGPITLDLNATNIFQQFLGRNDVLLECRFTQVTGAFMAKAMACEFMARFHNRAHQRWIPLREPAQREKSCLRSVGIKHLENASNIALHAALTGVPGGAINMRRKR